MLFSQVWANSESDLLEEFFLTTDIPVSKAQRVGEFLCLTVFDVEEIHRVSMRDLIGAYEHQQPMTIIYEKCFFEFTKIHFSVEDSECVLTIYFRCIKDARNIN